jgi:ABC-type long-subunit fatty acid transport system fused permease/ATPase subunit
VSDNVPLIIFQINALVWGVMAAVFWYRAGLVKIEIETASPDLQSVIEAFNVSSAYNRHAAYVTVAAVWFSVWGGLLPLLRPLFAN